mgnify:CR=1 FL=1
MSSDRKKIVSQQAAEYMKECGVPNNLQSRFLYELCQIIHQNDDPDLPFNSLIAETDILDKKCWTYALRLVFSFLTESQMNHTLKTINLENQNLERYNTNQLDDGLPTLEQLVEISHNLEGKTLNEKVEEFMAEMPVKLTGDKIKESIPDIPSSDSEQIESLNFDEDDLMDQRYDE